MQEAIYEGKYFDLKVHMESQSDVKREIDKLKKRADKGAFQCPYCQETLILKSGDIREEHFAHRHSKSCEISVASEVYQKQVKRESKKHSVMKEIIYDELKTQEKINKDIKVDYGFIKKASEKWRHYPDIIVHNKNRELAVTILTNVTSNKDTQLVKQIKNRNKYFKSKNLEPIWFIEDVEQSVDMDNRVIHLWEAEFDLAVQTAEDLLWEDAINSLQLNQPLFKLFDYHYTNVLTTYKVRSVYYVHSTETSIKFSVQRFIKDRDQYPFRAFALNDAYQISLSTALWTTEDLQLSDPKVELQQREFFVKEVKRKQDEYALIAQEKQSEYLKRYETQNTTNQSKREGRLENKYIKTVTESRYRKVRRENKELPALKDSNLSNAIMTYVRNHHLISATEVSEYLVSRCGAPSETFLTGRYRVYVDVCRYLDGLENKGILELLEKDVNDRVYRLIG